MLTLLRQSLRIFLVLTLVTGVAYPLLVTLAAQTLFPHQAYGSLLRGPGERNEEPAVKMVNRDAWFEADAQEVRSPRAPSIGSELIGQSFNSPQYFWGRPSATSPTAYSAAASTGSNLGPTNPAQLAAVQQRVAALRKAHHDDQSPVPVDLATASGSGLDPHISPAAADYQVPRVAQARGLSEYLVRRLVVEHTEGRTLGLLGEPRVNVLLLNLALDELR